MQAVVILHNMVDEEREWSAGTEGEEFTEGVVVRNGTPPMWQGLVPVTTTSETPAAPGTIAARCALAEFTTHAAEKALTKRLLIDHLWSHHGNL